LKAFLKTKILLFHFSITPKGIVMKQHALYLILALCSLIACEKSMYVPSSEIKPPVSTEIKYLALGDSYTIGTSVNYMGRFPKQLIEALRESDTTNTYAEPSFVARNGWTTTALLNALNGNDTLAPPYELVSLLIGVNNQFQQRPFGLYEEDFPELLSQAITLAGGDSSRVFVVSIPDYAFTPFGQNTSNPAVISEQLDAYNAYNKQIAEDWGISYFDITSISRKGLEEPALVASDNLHPSALQYERWVGSMLAEILLKLEE
jgi:acyl-CoA thioesterase-1